MYMTNKQFVAHNDKQFILPYFRRTVHSNQVLCHIVHTLSEMHKMFFLMMVVHKYILDHCADLHIYLYFFFHFICCVTNQNKKKKKKNKKQENERNDRDECI